VDDDQGQRLGAIFSASFLGALPVAPTPNPDSGSDFDQSLLWLRQMNLAREQKAGNGLDMPAA
jgi:hypothetical protein